MLVPDLIRTYPVISVDTRSYEGTTYLAVPSQALAAEPYRPAPDGLEDASRRAWRSLAKRVSGDGTVDCRKPSVTFEAYDPHRRSTLRVELCAAQYVDELLRCVGSDRRAEDVMAEVNANQRQADSESQRHLRFLDLESTAWVGGQPW